MLAVKLLFRDHFHINTTDEVDVGHSMRRWEVGGVSFRKLPPTNLVLVAISSPVLGLLRDISCLDSLTLPR